MSDTVDVVRQRRDTASSGASAWERRDVLAAERTFLAWIRTCLAMIAAGAGLATFPGPRFHVARALLGVGLLILAGGLASASCLRWERVVRAARADQPPVRTRGAWAVTAAMVLLSGILAGLAGSQVAAGHGTGMHAWRRVHWIRCAPTPHAR